MWRPPSTTVSPPASTVFTAERPATKTQASSQRSPARAAKSGWACIEQHDVGAHARSEGADRLAQRLRAAGERRLEQHARGRVAGPAGHDVAGAVGEALTVFELAELGGDIDLDVGIGADAEASARRQIVGAIEDAVAERGLGQRAEAGDRAGRGEPAGFRCVMWVAWMRHQRESRPALSSEPLHRPPAQLGHAFLDLPHLLGDMDVDRAVGHRVRAACATHRA